VQKTLSCLLQHGRISTNCTVKSQDPETTPYNIKVAVSSGGADTTLKGTK
jgi:hypothetical protein